MGFSEAVKLSAKRNAHFKCCICQRPSVSLEAHHIIPEADGGPDTEDNAAPLCPTCHAEYGANPEKRTAIRVQRDFWYEICANRYAPDADLVRQLIGLLERANTIGDGSLSNGGHQISPVTPAIEAEIEQAVLANPFPMRALTEIFAEIQESMDRAEYYNHVFYMRGMEQAGEAMHPGLRDMFESKVAPLVKRYRDTPGQVLPVSEFFRGWEMGRYLALLWVLMPDGVNSIEIPIRTGRG
jgi:hypothetical protein